MSGFPPASDDVTSHQGGRHEADLTSRGRPLPEHDVATIYYVNRSDYYADRTEGDQFHGRISSLEYFKDEDVSDAPN